MNQICNLITYNISSDSSPPYQRLWIMYDKHTWFTAVALIICDSAILYLAVYMYVSMVQAWVHNKPACWDRREWGLSTWGVGIQLVVKLVSQQSYDRPIVHTQWIEKLLMRQCVFLLGPSLCSWYTVLSVLAIGIPWLHVLQLMSSLLYW